MRPDGVAAKRRRAWKVSASMPAGRFTDRARARRASRRASRGRRRGGAATARCTRATPPRIAMGLRNAKQSGPGLARAPDMKLVRARWWGAAAGVVLAVVDTLTISALGVRFEMNGHHVSPLVGVWFGSSFALLGFLAGYVVEGRRRDRRQAEVIRAQTEAIAATRARLAQTEKLAALGQLAAAVAHEVRSPLAVIRSAAPGLAEAAPSGGEVALAAAAADGGVEIAVADSGPGVPPELRARIFEPFFTTRPRGTGLGLAVARQIVEAHGGRIEVGERTGGGARFTLCLPAAA